MYCLRGLEKRDLEIINKWEYVPELINFSGASLRYINPIADVKWSDYLQNCENTIRCAIVDKTDIIIGLVSLIFIDYINLSAVFQIIIGDKASRKKGIGTWATSKILNHAFYNMNLNRVEFFVLNKNTKAIRLIEKCGFVCEGKKRSACYNKGKLEDLLMYSILRNQFESSNIRMNKLTDIPFWCIDYITAKGELDRMIGECFPQIYAKNNYKEFLEKIYSKGITLIAYNRECIGFCTFYANDIVKKEMYITLIAVKSKYQGLHIGKNLLKVCIEDAKRRGMKTCVLEVQKDNESAIRFYKINGFQDFKETETSYYLKKQLLQ